MISRKISILFALLLASNILFAQNNSTLHQFLGKVSVHGKNAKDVVIKAFEGDSCFSVYETRSNGKFAFYGEGENNFILQFEKPGYSTKQLVVNTKYLRQEKNDVVRYKFNINLQKTKKGESDHENIDKIDVIQVDNSGEKFTYRVNRNKEEYFGKSDQLLSMD